MVTKVQSIAHSNPKKDFSIQVTPNLVLKVSHLPQPPPPLERDRSGKMRDSRNVFWYPLQFNFYNQSQALFCLAVLMIMIISICNRMDPRAIKD